MACPENSSLDLCATLSETGSGIGEMVETIRLPVGKFILFLAVIGAVVALVLGIVFAIKTVATKHLK